MTTVSRNPGNESAPLKLHAGDRMEQEEFHLRYDVMPEDYRAELIAGIVHEPSPLGYEHGTAHVRLASLLNMYATSTPGLSVACGATVILGPKDEVQPDLLMRIDPCRGGQSKNIKINSRKYGEPITYIQGAPELVAEIAHSSGDIDLHLKKKRYVLAGVLEYIVVNLRSPSIHWFDLKNGKKFATDTNGVFQSHIFPGLWIHEQGLLTSDNNLTMKWLHHGLQSDEHRVYVSG